LFLSFFCYNKIHNVPGVTRHSNILQYVPHGLKLIYPYHHFW
jgi:hypothetical protein